MQESTQEPTNLRIGKRIAEIAVIENLNQKSLAEKIGVSQGFLSSVMNDQKIPGSEFIYSLKRVFGISADWVLTGEGTMYGGGKINIRLQKEIQLYLAVARAAIVESNATAKKVLLMIRQNQLQNLANDENVQTYLNNIVQQNLELDLVTAIYNNNIWVNDKDLQRQNIVMSAMEYFQLNTPVDIFSKTKDQDKSNIQINIAGSQKNVQGNYYER